MGLLLKMGGKRYAIVYNGNFLLRVIDSFNCGESEAKSKGCEKHCT